MADKKLEENIDTESLELSSEEAQSNVENISFEKETLLDEKPLEPNLKDKFTQTIQVILPKILSILRGFFSIKLTHILYALGVLIFALFVFLFFELKEREYQKDLIGYVKINHKVPEWHTGKDLPEEAMQHLENYRIQQEKLKEKFIIITKNRHEGKEVLGDPEQNPITNEEMFATLKKQNIGRVTEAGVEKPENMNLSGFNLSKINFKYFREFIGGDLRYTIFNGIQEEGLSFRGSSLTYSQFVDSLIPNTNFIRTYLSFTNFYSAVLDGSAFIGVIADSPHFKEARMVSCNFIDSKIKDGDFSETILDQANFKNTYLTGNNFKSSSLRKVNFRNAQLQGSSFIDADLEEADFTNANLEGVDFTGANLLNAKFKDADITQAKFANTKNVTLKQLDEALFLLSAKSIPQEIIPKKQSWLERFAAPNDPNSPKR